MLPSKWVGFELKKFYFIHSALILQESHGLVSTSNLANIHGPYGHFGPGALFTSTRDDTDHVS